MLFLNVNQKERKRKKQSYSFQEDKFSESYG